MLAQYPIARPANDGAYLVAEVAVIGLPTLHGPRLVDPTATANPALGLEHLIPLLRCNAEILLKQTRAILALICLVMFSKSRFCFSWKALAISGHACAIRFSVFLWIARNPARLRFATRLFIAFRMTFP